MVNNEFRLKQLKNAKRVVVTPHALERGYDEETIKEDVTDLAGAVYYDSDESVYHLVAEDRIYIIRVDGSKRLVITAYPNDEAPRYHDPQYHLLRG